MFVLDKIVQATEMNNGEKDVELYSVRVHETDTGYAEAFREDLDWVKYKLEDIKISDHVKAEWADPEMYDKLLKYNKNKTDKPFKNKIVTQQV
jgi:6-pyruvoyltetrahydropterin/6-carboxytetrahydropterin synthase